MITPFEAATLCKAIYSPVDPAAFSSVMVVDGITAGMVGNVIAFAGSQTLDDWVRDFDVLQHDHPQLGVLHAGMWQGMANFFAQFKQISSAPLVLTGHSLGCSHAAMFAGLCSINGIAVEQLILFAPPRCSFQQLRDMLHDFVPNILAYRNGFDPVPEVPFTIPIIEPWHPIADYIGMVQPPADRENLFHWHSIDLYCQGAPKTL